jgi:hypothetical protein
MKGHAELLFQGRTRALGYQRSVVDETGTVASLFWRRRGIRTWATRRAGRPVAGGLDR